MADQNLTASQKWHVQVLEFARSIVGLPALVVLATNIYTDDKKIEAIVTAIALFIALGLSLIGRLRFKIRGLSWLDRRHVLTNTLPWLLTGVLVFVLVFIIGPIRARRQTNLLANSWLQWQKSLEDSAGQCRKLARCLNKKSCKTDQIHQYLSDDSSCLANKVSPVLLARPHPQLETDVTGLAGNVLAGQLLLANENTREILSRRLSTGGRFLGTGLAIPANEKEITSARVPEFFVPNLSDKSAHVWVWELDRGQKSGKNSILDTKLLDVLQSFKPLSHPDFNDIWDSVSQHLTESDPRQPLVRFGLFRHDDYSGCLGRPEATRVFMIGLSDVAGKTVQEAARSSGYTIPSKGDEPGLKLFVWVYAPDEGGQAVPATWANVLENFGKWVIDDPCRKEH